MFITSEEQLIQYLRQETEKRSTLIPLTTNLPVIGIKYIYDRLFEMHPKLFPCISSVSIRCIPFGICSQLCLDIRYSNVYPAFVTAADNAEQARKSLLRAAERHRRSDFLVCRKSDLSEILEAANGITMLPEFLNRFLTSVCCTVTKREECSFCGVEVTLGYSCDYSTSQSRRELMNQKVEEIAQLAAGSGTEDWRKAITAIRYCVEHWRYKQCETMDTSRPEFTAYGALINNEAVCMGMSLAVCEIFRGLGIPCRYVCGYRSGVPHGWNMVYIKGGWFYIDVTDAVAARNEFFHWGVTAFDDNRTIISPQNEAMLCNCPKEYIIKNR